MDKDLEKELLQELLKEVQDLLQGLLENNKEPKTKGVISFLNEKYGLEWPDVFGKFQSILECAIEENPEYAKELSNMFQDVANTAKTKYTIMVSMS